MFSDRKIDWRLEEKKKYVFYKHEQMAPSFFILIPKKNERVRDTSRAKF